MQWCGVVVAWWGRWWVWCLAGAYLFHVVGVKRKDQDVAHGLWMV